jgi:hypothetical protein
MGFVVSSLANYTEENVAQLVASSVLGAKTATLIKSQGNVMVDCHGVEIPPRKYDVLASILETDLINILKSNNKIVCHMQEGPVWLFNEYDLTVQFNYFNKLNDFDLLLAHNESDVLWYKGLFPNKPVKVMPTLMIEHHLRNFTNSKTNNVIIGGNFSRWYGGFQSFIVANEFDAEKWTQDSHSKRTNEEHIEGLNHLPRLMWVEWMKQLSTFKYAIHLMPTVAAGTFSLNCAYFGIPCIGNKKLDTQNLCHPELSVDPEDINAARQMANRLNTDNEFFMHCSKIAKENYTKYYDLEIWKSKMYDIFNTNIILKGNI